MMSDATNTQALSVPDSVLVALSVTGIDPAQFGAVIEAFGSLPNEGQVELVNRLIRARGQYLCHRMSECDATTRQGVLRSRLKNIGSAAERLLQLLNRGGVDPQPWNLHPAVTLALSQLCRIASERCPNRIRDPLQRLSLLRGMLADLAEVGKQAETIFEARFPKKHGGKRREGSNAATGLVDQLIEIYEVMRAQFPESGSPPSFGEPLVKFVRAGLALATTPRTIWLDGTARPSLFEAALLEPNLPKPTRITDAAIRGAFQRRPTQTKVS